MITDHPIQVRRALVTALTEGDAGLLATVYGEAIPAQPDRPAVSVGFVIAGPEESWCFNGITGTVAINAWSDSPMAAEVYNIAAAVGRDLHLQRISLEGGGVIHTIRLTNATPSFPTEKRTQFRIISQFDIETSE